MPSTTLYYGKRDTPVWEVAKQFAERDGVSLSRLVTEALEDHLPRLAAQPSREERWAALAAGDAA